MTKLACGPYAVLSLHGVNQGDITGLFWYVIRSRPRTGHVVRSAPGHLQETACVLSVEPAFTLPTLAWSREAATLSNAEDRSNL